MEEISWTDRVRNRSVRRVKEDRNILHTVNDGRVTGLVTTYVGTAF
jgi:ketosteroid isomerase-like protein